MSGWGQSGPLAQAAGHDLNYIAVSGALNAIGPAGDRPAIPLNLIGDFGGGALYLAFGLLAAFIHAGRTGEGQVVDAAMIDGAVSLQTMYFGLQAAGLWNSARGANAIDSGSHFYQVYRCADGKYVSVAAVEGRFHSELLTRLGIDPGEIGEQMNAENWPRARALLEERFLTRSRDAWCAALEGTDACFAPVMNWSEAAAHPHVRARDTIIEVDGVPQPAPAPRFSRTPSAPPTAPVEPDARNVVGALAAWMSADEIARQRAAGAID
jgi:crotonobetainyl-CoA:carnitine CoA-transferase CaiB-like acyl-CoA transferase